MFELIYRICRINSHDDIITICRLKDKDSLIDNVVNKYNIPLSEDPIDKTYKDGFYIREMEERPLNENLLNHYLDYHKSTQWKRGN